ncbi:hydroxyethylthiazole kinase [Trinickia sp. NRRL B-1857]|uniref:M23 family metallopeptidase n=1 Tax=Trinickia sp. NRRL B-1857 TaxID=3162879 RepID=UPI003D2E966F
MIISPPFLVAAQPQQNDVMSTADVGNSVVPDGDVCATNMLECSPGNGAYPISFNLGWHGGAHLIAPTDGNQPAPVRAIADGKVVHVRATDTTKNPALQYRGVRTDDGCVVIRHDTEIGEGDNAKITFYSVYMHLQTVMPTLAVGKKIYRKDILGTPGQIYGQFPQIHFEIVCDEANLKKIIGREPGPVGQTGRTDAVYGDIWFFVPKGAKLFANEPHPYRDDDSAPAVGGLHAQSSIVGTGTSCDLVFRMHYDKDCTFAAYVQDAAGNWSASGAMATERDAEYNLYKRASDLQSRYNDGSLAGVTGIIAPSPSAIFEMIRFGRCVVDQIPNGASFYHWRKVNTPDGEGWVNLSLAAVRIYSDADFPEWAGWSFIKDDPTPDSLCDSPTVKQWLDVNHSGHVTHADAIESLRNDVVKRRLAYAVCKFPSEWSRIGRFDRYMWLKSPHEALSSPLSNEDFLTLMEHARVLGFWEDIVDVDLPPANQCWHFPVTGFIKQMRNCRWLSFDELELIYPNTYFEKSDGKLHQADNALSDDVRNRYGVILNRLMEKHSITRNPNRMSHFLGQGAQESRTLAWMNENRSEASCNSLYARSNGNDLPGDGYKFRGRGMKQLTGKYNYVEYWVYRGWLARSSFTPFWWSRSHPIRPNIPKPDILLTVPYNTIDAGAWYWEASPNRGLPHLRSTINIDADYGVNEEVVKGVTRAINGGLHGEENRIYHTLRLYKLLGDD